VPGAMAAEGPITGSPPPWCSNGLRRHDPTAQAPCSSLCSRRTERVPLPARPPQAAAARATGTAGLTEKATVTGTAGLTEKATVTGTAILIAPVSALVTAPDRPAFGPTGSCMGRPPREHSPIPPQQLRSARIAARPRLGSSRARAWRLLGLPALEVQGPSTQCRLPALARRARGLPRQRALCSGSSGQRPLMAGRLPALGCCLRAHCRLHQGSPGAAPKPAAAGAARGVHACQRLALLAAL